jgi:hypothetical protein
MNLRLIHAGLASVTVAGGVALVAAGAWAALRPSATSVRLVLLVRRVALIGAVLALLAGAARYTGGGRPHLGLHYLYAFFAVAAVPLAASMAARRPRHGGLYHLGAGLLLLLMSFRLATTG